MLEANKADVEKIRSSPFIPDGIPVSGYLYDVNTGALQTVSAPTPD